MPAIGPLIRLAVFAVGLLLVTTWPAAQPYRSVDENGETVYSQSPPEGGAATQVEIAPAPPAAQFDAARTRLQQQLESEVDAAAAESKAAGEQTKAAEQAALRQKNCEGARQNLNTLQTLGARRLRQPDGSVAPVPADERARMISEAEKQITENCK